MRHPSHVDVSGARVQVEVVAPGGESKVDVTGAGDSFCGGFSVGMAQFNRYPIEKRLQRAVKMGLISASYTIEGYGALYPLRSDLGDKRYRLEQLDQA